MEGRIWTLMEVLRWTATNLAQLGQDSPRLEAELLLAHCLGLTRIELYTLHDRPMEQGELAAFKELVRRRRLGEPIAYLLGRREFWNHRFQVDRRVMVPRPESEMLVEEALAFGEPDEPLQVADACTGSGCVILSILAERPAWLGVGTDVSAEALEVAGANRAELGLEKRCSLRQGDGLAPVLPLKGRPFDLVTANPPYVPDGEWADLPPDIRDFEPRISVTSEADGLGVIRRLIPQAAQALRSGGLFVMEYSGEAQSAAILELASRAGFQRAEVLKDVGGLDRVLRAFKA
jgi:release factor glutamine methyltransferase